jgi:G3E family GTPase
LRLVLGSPRTDARPGHQPAVGHWLARWHGADHFDTLAFRRPEPLDPRRFDAFLRSLPVQVFRGKGILHVAGFDGRLIFQQVGSRWTLEPGAPWAPGENRQTELVFIGQGLAPRELEASLAACLMTPDAPTRVAGRSVP